jgi:type I restriction-modification system DNA methylase subunit
MSIILNEIRIRASKFCKEWENKAPKAREEADAQDFQTDFLYIFGVTRREVAFFEHRVDIDANENMIGEKKVKRRGYIDLFWKGHILIEMKTPGKDRVKAFQQAKEYAESLPHELLPSGILISDFNNFDHYDLDKNFELTTFTLHELPEKLELFGYLIDRKDIQYQAISPVDIEAAELMGELYDALKENRYPEHELELFLVRLLFCLFADDSGIFDEKKVFFKYIKERTSEDGSDLALHIDLIFQELNKPPENRQTNRDEAFKKFPYVDGGLFEKRLDTAAFNSKMRKTLLKCCTLDWSKIKPEIFGAMFQSIKDKEKRRALGEHYTSEENILKVIKPLFLDELWEEFEKIRKLTTTFRIQRLLEFHTKLQKLKFLDPACGCGNFLVVSYRELRILEIEILSEYLQTQQVLDIELMVRVNVDQFYGIEILEFPARIAQTALWLMDHLMNTIASHRFGKYIARIPLTTSPSIVIENAIRIDWENLIPKTELSYILGNPPFVGYKFQTDEQKIDMRIVYPDIKNLDYVCAWYKKVFNYIQSTEIKAAFVSTNSICQGEQVAQLWQPLISNGLRINFAVPSFVWSNEAKGKAAVHCVIVGFSLNSTNNDLNPYLLNAPTVFIERRNKPICSLPRMQKGNEMYDDCNLIIEADEYEDFIRKEPLSKKYIKRYVGSEEFINNKIRYCIWLLDVDPNEIKKMPYVMQRIEAVRKFRLKSNREATKKTASTPSIFSVIHQPTTDYILVPVISSEKRDYIPIGFMSPETIVSYAVFTIPSATLYHFGILTSKMHMAWTRYICGRLEMRYRYSNDLVYNNFPCPEPTEKQKTAIEEAAQEVLNCRAKFPNSNLAALYDPLTMPPALLKAHQKLDKDVETAYKKTFSDDEERISHLFYLYQKLTEGLFADTVKKPRKSNVNKTKSPSINKSKRKPK